MLEATLPFLNVEWADLGLGLLTIDTTTDLKYTISNWTRNTNRPMVSRRLEH